MPLQISAKQMRAYQATARQRRHHKMKQLESRRQRAWEVAKQAAKILKEQFYVQQVVVFGSLLFSERFHQRSDIDLAVWGVAEEDYYRAVAWLQDIEPSISVDLIEAEYAPAALLAVIEREGVSL